MSTVKNKSTASTCKQKELNALLSRYQDGELDHATREKIDSHLQECSVCKEELSLLEMVTSGVKQLPQVDVSPRFTAELMDRVNRTQRTGKRWGFRFTLPSVVYSLVFLLFLGLGFIVNGLLTGSPVAPAPGFSARQEQSQELQIAQLLNESQQLTLIHVQDQTMDLLESMNLMNGTNGESHDQ
jgi:anti-sigma factor RsiW